MKKNKVFLFLLIILICILGIGSIIITSKNNKETKNSKKDYIIPEGYIAVFHGSEGEITHDTYIYKQANGHENYGFDYINVTNTTEHWGSSQWNSEITKKGSVQWTDNVFGVAKKNGAYSYVTLPNSDKIYTIEEFMSIFLMN